MKVISVATNGGFYGDLRRRNGDVFMIPDVPRRTPSEKEAKLEACKEVMDKAGTVPECFSSLWMRKAPKGSVEKISAAPRASAPSGADLSRARIAPDPGGPGAPDPGDFVGGDDGSVI